MCGLDHAELKCAVQKGRFEWRRHALEQMAARGLAQAAVIEVLTAGEKIEDYPHDRPYPSALFLGWVKGEPLHVVAALDDADDRGYIITTYRPDEETFEADYRTRREKT